MSDRFREGIKHDRLTNSYTVAQGFTGRVLAGIDPVYDVEYRSFLAFNLVAVRKYAIIKSAWLDIYVNSVDTQFSSDTIPLRIDLVSFDPSTLFEDDFDSVLQPALASIPIDPPISREDANQPVPIDVTSLMVEAQRRGLPYFQLRIMENLGVENLGLVEINDTAGADRIDYAPLLTVTYY